MKISIVMTTYNGEKYIIEQLESILGQTRLPDEVIICDDVSSDNTEALIRKFIVDNSLYNWVFTRNERNKGWQKNFLDAIAMATGDIIFCADHDDVWMSEKVELMSQIMENDSRIKCLSGKLVTIDSNGKEFESKSVHSAGNNTGAIINIPFTREFNNITLLGCTLCFTREIAEAICKINVGSFSHDAQIGRLSTIFNGTYIVDRSVIKYRIHQSNTSGIVKGICFGSSNLKKRIDVISNNLIWLDAVISFFTNSSRCDAAKLNVLRGTRNFLSDRLQFLKTKSIIKYICLFKYISYYSNLGMYLGDFCYAFGINKAGGECMWVFKKSEYFLLK
jgi:glycosyltransferase involved in cell wall biosynthesis